LFISSNFGCWSLKTWSNSLSPNAIRKLILTSLASKQSPDASLAIPPVVRPATSVKYLLETMGGGVAIFDYDNDGRMDLFFTNGALLKEPMPKGAMPDKTDPSLK
jgi:hypothetical protein